MSPAGGHPSSTLRHVGLFCDMPQRAVKAFEPMRMQASSPISTRSPRLVQ